LSLLLLLLLLPLLWLFCGRLCCCWKAASGIKPPTPCILPHMLVQVCGKQASELWQ
jgi:hypothetical protein